MHKLGRNKTGWNKPYRNYKVNYQYFPKDSLNFPPSQLNLGLCCHVANQRAVMLIKGREEICVARRILGMV